ncbi:iron chelate uptake ABC transporter, FeCT family, permease protein [Treponema phagedenis F0421]|uniref:iron chelate uptake ABC transporter family permease subunit n=1 Tax=Treponema phagedenis TaxID=162 RepID=UPI0001F63C2A|nr:iron chelate uptake ABC transporter family permease subunit [Treponema phagedenis]EFW38052.1 iron chelate uptake ABC transporter, FeCT family, permease protein [Treponema phagedenis F0421]
MTNNNLTQTCLHNDKRSAKAFRSAKEQRHYFYILFVFFAFGLLASYGLLVYKNPVPVNSPSFLPVVKRRMIAVTAMIIAATCHGLSTVAFQSVTNNRIITPSLLGFEALYSAIHTSTIFFFGITGLMQFTGMYAFIIQIVIMVGVCILLYGFLLSGKYGDLQLMLLVGVILGTGLRSISAFMRRLLAPSEFDILQARLFGSVNNADPVYFHVAIPLVLVTSILLLFYSKKLNALSLGKDICTNLGIPHKRCVIYTLILVSILMSVSTALVGPITFLGFLVAALTYQIAPTYDHRYVFPMVLAVSYTVLTGAYFLMYHIFSAQGVVSLIIELFGGLAFLIVILRKGKL